ncbi:MAG: glucose-6-phosphate isomerase [Neisseriaceae bacterium]|nr:glucose-6-phosphate isomerase [Neisseriaceae bacterium]
MNFINQTAIWAQLHQHQRATHYLHMRDLFAQDPERFNKMHQKLNGLLFDYSKNRITEDTLKLLIELAETAQIKEWIDKMRTGKAINLSEDRPVLHTALRQPKTANIYVAGENVIPKIHEELDKSLNLAERSRQQDYLGFSGKPITNIVNIGIGGSDLGPRMLYVVLKPYHHEKINVYYVSNVDAAHLGETLKDLNPENTLFIIASKSFTTPETLLNAMTAKKWFIEKTQTTNISQHFLAITSNKQAALDYGIAEDNIFGMFDWVGGRYSSWSSISLSVMCAIGRDNFLEFLEGGRNMDEHFFSSPYSENIPVLMGLIGVWYNTFYQSSSHAIIPYDHSLRRFPAHIQQLDMESNGKRTGRNGEHLDFDTGAVIWGEEGVNCQHAFFQLLHQGTRLICSDFIVIANSFYPEQNNQHQVLVANALAQTRALMQGKTEAEVYQELNYLPGIERDKLAPQKFFPGNQPTNTIFLERLTPFNLGMLLALYEHKVFVQGIIWGINSFDQWGVEYGKVLAKNIEPLLSSEDTTQYDSSTNHLIDYFRKHNKPNA